MGSYSLLATVNLETSDPEGVDRVSVETKAEMVALVIGREEQNEEVKEET